MNGVPVRQLGTSSTASRAVMPVKDCVRVHLVVCSKGLDVENRR